MLYSRDMPSDLFRLFPPGGSRSTSLGKQTVPYHVYDGEALLIGGWVEAGTARDLLAGQSVELVLDRQGRALACLWVCEFTQSNLGEHRQLQLSLAVTREAVAPVRNGPFELVRLILLEPGLRLFSAAFWNDTPVAAAYNRELLGLDAQLCRGHFSRGEESGFVSCRIENMDEQLVFQADIAPPSSQSFWDGLVVERGLGRLGMRKLTASPWLAAQVMAPGGKRFLEPCEAQVYLQARSAVLSRFSTDDARLDFGPAFPVGLDFRPAFLEHFLGCEFVYLLPYNHGDGTNGNPTA
jgi:hypothetical protein